MRVDVHRGNGQVLNDILFDHHFDLFLHFFVQNFEQLVLFGQDQHFEIELFVIEGHLHHNAAGTVVVEQIGANLIPFVTALHMY